MCTIRLIRIVTNGTIAKCNAGTKAALQLKNNAKRLVLAYEIMIKRQSNRYVKLFEKKKNAKVTLLILFNCRTVTHFDPL